LLDELERRVRSVVLGEHAGSDLSAPAGIVGGTDDFDGTDERFQLFERNSTWTEKSGPVGELKDGRFDSDRTGAPIEDVIDAVGELFGDVLGCGGTDAAEEIGTGGSDGKFGESKDLLHERMSRDAQTDLWKSGSDEVGDDIAFGEDERQGTGPETGGESLGQRGKVSDALPGVFGIGDVNDEGIEFRALLGCENFGDGTDVERVPTESVDGLGRERDDASLTENAGGGLGGVADGGHGERAVKKRGAKKTGEPSRLPRMRINCSRRVSFRNDVGEEGHEPGTQDGVSDCPLILGAVSGPATGDHVPFAVDHDLERAEVLVVDIDGARTPFGRAETAAELPFCAGLFAFVRSLGFLAEPKRGGEFVHAVSTPGKLLTHNGQRVMVDASTEKSATTPRPTTGNSLRNRVLCGKRGPESTAGGWME